MTGRLPFTLTPLPGEPFGLWWNTYAGRLGVTCAELAHTAGIPAGNPPRPEHAPAIAAAAGLPTDQVAGMFTSARPCPPPPVLRIWTPQPTDRFCPDCLADGQPWQPTWNLPLSFHCLIHNRPLDQRCPACGQEPLHRGRPRRTTRVASSCPSCGHTLTRGHQQPTGRNNNNAAAAQQRISTALHQMRDPADTPTRRQQAQDELTDITLVALHLAHDDIDKRHGRYGFTARLPDAAAFTEAVLLLTRPHPKTEHDRLAGLVARHLRTRRPPAVPFSWRAASPTLTSRITRCRDTMLTPLERLRYATTLPDPTARARQQADPAPARATRLPDQLWPVWAIRLTDDDSIDGPVFRSAMAAALLLPRSDLQLNEIGALLPHRPTAERVAHQLRRLAATPNGHAALQILTELALALDHADVPIDYPRRRRLAADTELIDRPTWDTLSRDAGLHIGRRRRLDLARCYLYELLTGGNLATAPHPYRLPEGPLRVDHVEFCAAMPAALAAALTAHADRLLATAGITGEPLTWHPPTDWVSATTWPGADPERTDPEPIHQALLTQWASTPHNHWAPTQAIADNLGISSHHLRDVLRRHPIPRPPYRQTGNRTLIASPANDGPGHRATPRPGRQPAFQLDPEWLRGQYSTWGRTLKDIAAEIGCQHHTLRNFAEAHGIPRRPRGGGTNYIRTGTITGHPADLPELLRKALTGPGARGRLERFLLITDHPSLTRAAAAIGINASTLTMQLHTLERACGGPLLQRRARPQPIGPPTPLGEQLRQQAHQHLDPTPTRP